MSMDAIATRMKKVARTLQSQAPFLKDAKDELYHHCRRALRIVHDDDLRVVGLLPPSARGHYVDVGANLGQTIASIRLLRPSAEIVSFEPNPLVFRKLARRYGRTPGIRLVDVGLSDAAGRFELHVPSYNGFVYDGLASFDREAAEGWLGERTIYGFDRARLSVDVLECRTERLDDQGLAPDFVKVDVQGLEHAVLAGGRRTLREHEPVLMIEGAELDDRIEPLLRSLGYAEYLLDGGACRPGRGSGRNAIFMTAARAASLAEGPANRRRERSRS
jgi:FkbM family methyltransferase